MANNKPPIVDRRVQLEFRQFVTRRWAEHKARAELFNRVIDPRVVRLKPTIQQLEREFQQELSKNDY